ncbi:MAG: cytochrome c-type biogenesis protein CcmH, partial [Gemmatimonadetes bacterium]|nr:cytochrome c-type biogenesis protein CcmH [Gemmatimonadota bacterium]
MPRGPRLFPLILGFSLAPQPLSVVAPLVAQSPQSSTVVVEETPTDMLVRQIASELRCVVCQGLSLQDSPSELAQEMRGVIREKLEEGLTAEQVKQYFVARYGEFILLEPEPAGFNLAVYLLPAMALVGGAVVVLVAIRRWTSRPVAS